MPCLLQLGWVYNVSYLNKLESSSFLMIHVLLQLLESLPTYHLVGKCGSNRTWLGKYCFGCE